MFDMHRLLKELEAALEEKRKEAREEGFPVPKQALIRILGQVGLMVHPDTPKELNLFATADVDALINADHSAKQLFKQLVARQGLEYDEVSEEAWVPKESTFTRIHDAPALCCEVLDPVYILLSKAVKAKEKNRILVRDALSVYGEKLAKLIKKHGGDPDYFRKKK